MSDNSTKRIVTIVGSDPMKEKRLAREISEAAEGLAEIQVGCASNGDAMGSVVFLDGSGKDPRFALANIDRKGRSVFLVEQEGCALPEAWVQGEVDGVLLRPIRPLELISQLKIHDLLTKWHEVTHLSASFADMAARLRDDLSLAERLQKSKLPTRFTDLKGLDVQCRYLAGMRSGGDHFDLAESKDGDKISMVLTDSSSYGLSSAVLTALIKVAVKLSAAEALSCAETVSRIQEEILATLGEKDKLSLFYGIFSRKENKLRFLNLGKSMAMYAPPREKFQILSAQGGALTRESGRLRAREAEIQMEPEGRLVLLSNGFLDGVGGPERATDLLGCFRKADPKEGLNELVFEIKSKFTDSDDMPSQDCSALVMDIHSKVVKLSQRKA